MKKDPMACRLMKKIMAVFVAGALVLSTTTGEINVLAASGTNADTQFEDSGTPAISLLKDSGETFSFTNRSGGQVTTDANGGVVLSNTGSDHFATMDDQAPVKAFTYEADVNLANGGSSAALLFGIGNIDTLSAKWYAANFDVNNTDQTLRVFKIESGATCYAAKSKSEIGSLNLKGSLHLALTVLTSGEFTYTIADKGISDTAVKLKGTIPDYAGGSVGLLTYNSEATFSNITFTPGNFITNLQPLASQGNFSAVEESDGLHTISDGDDFLLSQTTGANFIYTADVKFNEIKNSAASLMFRSNGKVDDQKDAYIANINPSNGVARLFRFQGTRSYDISGTVNVGAANNYKLKVVATGNHIAYFINDILVANTGDYTITGSSFGQNSILTEGRFGLLTWNGNVTYQNVKFTPLTTENTPALTNLQIMANGGKVEYQNSFSDSQYVYSQYVSNDTESINIVPTAPSGTTVEITQDGNVVSGAVEIPEDKATLFTITTSRGEAKLVYRLYVLRRGDPASYYNEDYRGQYHYSVKNGWANDPNGMVKIGDTYHLFYQFYGNGTSWGPMHWMHATSKDMIHWTDQPITFYPDEYGAMFSGCAVYDENNTSGLFGSGTQGGLVALITADGGSGQHLIAAYSKDNGATWQKRDGVILDWTNDTLQDGAFRDPKVFRHNNKWFMVIAGGPLRIYSSTNLINWTCESTYAGLNTECPDFYRLPVKNADGTSANKYKWVLSRGGRYYKVGDFKEVDGKWTFVPDADFAGTGTANDGVMNFGKDSYAGMTFYNGKFGADDDFTEASQPRLVAINWMNTWDDYCNMVANATGNTRFNGTFNLALQLGLVKDKNGKYQLTQQPISEYDTLLSAANTKTYSNISVTPDKASDLNGFTGDSYKMTVTFKPNASATAFGADVRVGNGQKTEVRYDVADGKISIDRSQSGVSPTNLFKNPAQEHVLSRNNDGSLTLEMYVDRASLEVFSNDYTVIGASQIFPNPTSQGVSIFSEDGNVTADVTIQKLDSIWIDKQTPTAPNSVGLDKSSENLYVGDTVDLTGWVSPAAMSQNLEWSVTEGQNAVVLSASGNKATVTATAAGTAVITATAKGYPKIKATCTISVHKNDLQTNLSGWTPASGNWYINGETYYGSYRDNGFTYAQERTSPGTNTYTYSMDVTKDAGIVNLVFGSKATNAFEGCYAVQLREDGLRLFDFLNDHTFAQTDAVKFPSNTYHLDMTVSGLNGNGKPIISIKVNGTKYMGVEVDRKYTEGLFALGLYNAAAKFSNIYVTTDAVISKFVVPVENITVNSTAAAEQLQSQLPAKVQMKGSDGMIKPESAAVHWDLSKVHFSEAGSYIITAVLSEGLPVGYVLGSNVELPKINVTLTASPAAITKVTVTPSAVSMQKGTTYSFGSVVTGTNNPSQSVTWTVSGNQSKATTIGTDGTLTVAADETAIVLSVKAVSTVDSSKFGMASVTVENTSSSHNSDSSNHSDRASSVSSASTVTTTTTAAGGTVTEVATQINSSPIVTGNKSDASVTVPSEVSSVIASATVQKPAEIKITVPTASIVEQLKSSTIQTVHLTVQAPAVVANNPNSNATVSIDVEQAVLQTAKDLKKDVTVTVIDTDTGNEAYSMTFKGSDLASSTIEIHNVDIVMRVKPTTEVFPVNAVTANNRGLVLQFANNGILPSAATVKVYVGDKGYKAGQTVYFYYFNSATKTLEPVGNSATYTVDAWGFVNLTITHCSDYVLLPKMFRSFTLDTLTYTMAPKNNYEIGVKLTNSSGTTLKIHSSNSNVATAAKLKNGNCRVTGVKPGTTYIMFDVYDSKNKVLTHASVKVIVQNGVRSNGNSSKQIGIF